MTAVYINLGFLSPWLIWHGYLFYLLFLYYPRCIFFILHRIKTFWYSMAAYAIFFAYLMALKLFWQAITFYISLGILTLFFTLLIILVYYFKRFNWGVSFWAQLIILLYFLFIFNMNLILDLYLSDYVCNYYYNHLFPITGSIAQYNIIFNISNNPDASGQQLLDILIWIDGIRKQDYLAGYDNKTMLNVGNLVLSYWFHERNKLFQLLLFNG